MGIIDGLNKAGARLGALAAAAPGYARDIVKGSVEDWNRVNERAIRWGWINKAGWILNKYPAGGPELPPWALNYADHNEQSLNLNVLSGAIPPHLKGDLYIQVTTGTGSTGLPRPHNVPVFNSDGCIVRVRFDGTASPRVHKRYIKSASYLAERLVRGDLPLITTDPIGQLLYNLLVRERFWYRFYSLGMMRRSLLLGSRNMVNTGLMVFRDPGINPQVRLVATWDAGRPWELDTDSLAAATPIGRRAEWSPAADAPAAFPTILTSAHPVWDDLAQEGFFVDYGRGLAQVLHSNALSGAVLEYTEDLFNVVLRVLSTLPGFTGGGGQLIGQVVTWLAAWADAISPPNLPVEVDTFTNLKRWDGAGQLRDYRLVCEGKDVRIRESCHQMAVTRNHVLLMDTGVKIQFAGLLGGAFDYLSNARFLRAWLLRRVPEVAPIYIVPRGAFPAAENERLARISAGEVDTTPDVDVVRVDLPGQSAHFVADYEEAGGNLVLYVAHSSFTDVGEFVQRFDRRPIRSAQGVLDQAKGLPNVSSLDINRITRYVVDPKTGGILSSRSLAKTPETWTLALAAESTMGLPGPHTAAREYMYWTSLGFREGLLTEEIYRLYEESQGRTTSVEELRKKIAALETVPCTLFRLDTRTMEIGDTFTFDPRVVVSSPQFIPDPQALLAGAHAQQAGWISVVVFPEDNAFGAPVEPRIALFDAQNLAAGPICELSHPQLRFGYSVHTAFLKDTEVAPRTATYQVPPSDLTQGMWDVISAVLLDYEVVPRL